MAATMSLSRIIMLVFLLLQLLLPTVYCGGAHHHHHRGLGGASPSSEYCRGTVAECVAGGEGGEDGEEFEMSSEVSRRVLASSRYISYNALRRDSTPCSRRGASYYNCRPGAHANPYSRGCSAITRCRS